MSFSLVVDSPAWWATLSTASLNDRDFGDSATIHTDNKRLRETIIATCHQPKHMRAFFHSSKRLIVGLDSSASDLESSKAPLVPESEAFGTQIKPAEIHACFSRSTLTHVDALHLDAVESSFNILKPMSRSMFLNQS